MRDCRLADRHPLDEVTDTERLVLLDEQRENLQARLVSQRPGELRQLSSRQRGSGKGSVVDRAAMTLHPLSSRLHGNDKIDECQYRDRLPPLSTYSAGQQSAAILLAEEPPLASATLLGKPTMRSRLTNVHCSLRAPPNTEYGKPLLPARFSISWPPAVSPLLAAFRTGRVLEGNGNTWIDAKEW